MALHSTAQGLATLGRHGDSVLVHMQPQEVAGLQALAKSQGTSLTVNPNTGMPEAFNLGGFFKSLLPTLVGGAASMIPGMQFASYPLLTGILAGAATGALTNEDPLMGGLMGGLGGYSGAGIMGAGKAAAGAMGSAEAAKSAAVGGGSSGLATGGGFIPGATSGADLAYNNAMMASQAGGAANSAISGASGAMDVEKALAAGRPIGMANTFANTASVAPPPTFLGNMGNAFKGMGGAATGNQAAIDAYKIGMGTETGLGAFGKSMLPVGGAVLGGIEPSDLGYGGPSINELQRQTKYRGPSGQLNLDYNYNQDTGEYEGLPPLRLATGGQVDLNPSVGGGLSDLYNRPEGATTQSISNDGYGMGRLDRLAQQGSLSKAGDTFYAAGGPVSFADGGDTGMNLDKLPSLNVNTGEQVYADRIAGERQMNPLGQMMYRLTSMGSLKPTIGEDKQTQDFFYSPHIQYGTDPQTQQFRKLMETGKMAKGGYLNGQGDGMSDSIPATIEGKQPARLADGEFVVPADVVSHLGNGSSKAGSKRLYAMLDKVRHARTGNKKQGKQINPTKYMPV
jgi:hypothetical protein